MVDDDKSQVTIDGVQADICNDDMEYVTPEMIQSWKDLKVEICMFIRKNEFFWLVPTCTGKDRVELTPEDFLKQAAALKLVMDAFPDAKLSTILKPKELIK
jgi:hypothetical protein